MDVLQLFNQIRLNYRRTRQSQSTQNKARKDSHPTRNVF